MAARDPEARQRAASTAARARLARLNAEQRRDMTANARRALREHDLAAVDAEARRLGQYPLDDATRAFRADLLAAVRAKKASDAATRAMKLRREAAMFTAEREALLTQDSAGHQALAQMVTSPPTGECQT